MSLESCPERPVHSDEQQVIQLVSALKDVICARLLGKLGTDIYVMERDKLFAELGRNPKANANFF